MNKFDDIRPYVDQEIPAAMQRITSNASFPLLASYVFPDESIEYVRERLLTYRTIDEFQRGVMWNVNIEIMRRSTDGVTYSGIENLSPDVAYMYVSNHRDIMLDATFLQKILFENGFPTSQITFGANLMQGEVVIDVGKSNKMFRVERPGGSAREFYKSSLHLSEYMRHVIVDQHESIWIAQRNGRTKDGVDRTDQGIIKMFGMSRSDNKIQSLAELNIVPISISYEWESCDILKALELYAKRQGPYIKKPGEDLNSILTGIVQPKGRVHIHLCEPVTAADLQQFDGVTSSEFHRCVANLMDERICRNYFLTPNNFIAHDMRFGKTEYADRYTAEQKERFEKHIAQLSRYEEELELDILTDILLGIYANPVDSKKLFGGEV